MPQSPTKHVRVWAVAILVIAIIVGASGTLQGSGWSAHADEGTGPNGTGPNGTGPIIEDPTPTPTPQSSGSVGVAVGGGGGVVGGSVAPIIECKWELPDVEQVVGSNGVQYGNDDAPLVDAGFPCDRDDVVGSRPTMADNVQNVIQVLPNAENYPEARTIENWVAVEHPAGVDEIDDVFWKVLHPDGSFKIQIHGTKVGLADLDALGTPSQVGTMFWAANLTGQVTEDAITAQDWGIIDLVRQRQKDLWYAPWDIHKDQMCGAYTVEVTAVANGVPATMTNTLDIQCFFNLEIDFTTVNWGSITPGGSKVLPGDTTFGSADYPTVKNTGNSGMQVGVRFSNLVQDGVLGPKLITEFDAMFGKTAGVLQDIDPIPANQDTWFNNTSINQVLCSNQVGKLDLSIHPPSVIPAGSYSGTVTILAQHAPGVCWGGYDGLLSQFPPAPNWPTPQPSDDEPNEPDFVTSGIVPA